METAPLITTIVAGIGLAFVFGTIANRLRLSPIAGYLIAGVAVGPFTPGFIADSNLALQLADIGVILLMFGVGLHFSLRDLLSLRRALVPGVIAQVALSSSLGAGIALFLGWNAGAAVVFGLSLAVASTVVLLRALQTRRLIDTERGRTAVGWLVVQDVLTVIALVVIPALAPFLRSGDVALAFGTPQLAEALALTLGKLALFIAIMVIVARRAIPAILHYVAHSGSRELFRLAVLTVALGVAFGASELFGVSFALGAFLAGTILSESPLSARAAEESLPFRDAFAVLFFVSIGMLFDPRVVMTHPAALTFTTLAVVVGNGAIAFALTRLLGFGAEAAVVIAAGLSQIGEFSFILADLGIGLGLLDAEARALILGASIISILVNPLLFGIALSWHPAPEPPGATPRPDALRWTALSGHSILVGCGRVGGIVAHALLERNVRFLVIEDADNTVAALREKGIEVIAGNAVQGEVLDAANVKGAKRLFIAIPNGFEAGQMVQQARTLNPEIEIVARAHSEDEVTYLMKLGANQVIMGEREIAHGMIEYAFGTVPG